jgi:adenylate kinase family enzyme
MVVSTWAAPRRPDVGQPLGGVSVTVRVHIFGASGSGTTTLGRALAARIEAASLDTDDFYWKMTDPPYREPRSREARFRELQEALAEHGSWVLSGSLCGWGDPLIPLFELVVFLWVPTEVRIARLRAREVREFGAEALAPGGSLHRNHEEFIAWARDYDTGGLDMRSLSRHEAWLARISCPTIRFEGEVTVANQVSRILEELAAGS